MSDEAPAITQLRNILAAVPVTATIKESFLSVMEHALRAARLDELDAAIPEVCSRCRAGKHVATRRDGRWWHSRWLCTASALHTRRASLSLPSEEK